MSGSPGISKSAHLNFRAKFAEPGVSECELSQVLIQRGHGETSAVNYLRRYEVRFRRLLPSFHWYGRDPLLRAPRLLRWLGLLLSLRYEGSQRCSLSTRLLTLRQRPVEYTLRDQRRVRQLEVAPGRDWGRLQREAPRWFILF